MREILFRGKRVDNGQWVEGDLSHTNSGEPVIQYWVKSDRYKEGALIYFLVIPETVGQYTGLNDRNGNKIWEGDVGEIRTQSGRIERFVVQWGIHRRDMKSGWTVDIPGFCFLIDGFASFPIANNYLNGHDLDIIETTGNIHDNPELIAQ